MTAKVASSSKSRVHSVQALMYNQSPIGPNSYNVYLPTEQDGKCMPPPAKKYLLSRDLKNLLAGAFPAETEDYCQRAIGMLQNGLHELNNPTTSTQSTWFDVVEESDNQNSEFQDMRYQPIRYIRKGQAVRDQLILLSIEDMKCDKSLSTLSFRSAKGQILLFIQAADLVGNAVRILKNMKEVFGSNNLFFIVNGTARMVNCSYFAEIVKEGNHFIYAQKNLDVVKVANFNDRIYQFQLKGEGKAKEMCQCLLFLLEHDQFKSVLCSIGGLRAYLNKMFDELMKLFCDVQGYFQHEIVQMKLMGEPTRERIGIALTNCLISNKGLVPQHDFQAVVNIAIEFFEERRVDLRKKSTQTVEKNPDSHFALKLVHCKVCKVCQKYVDLLAEQSKLDKRHKEILKKAQQRQSSIKLHKSKFYCEGCSEIYGKEIPLCIIHFKQFHEDRRFFLHDFPSTAKKSQPPREARKEMSPEHSENGQLALPPKLQIEKITKEVTAMAEAHSKELERMRLSYERQTRELQINFASWTRNLERKLNKVVEIIKNENITVHLDIEENHENQGFFKVNDSRNVEWSDLDD